MTTENSLAAWCMDSLRWDSFQIAQTPNFDEFTDFQMVYSRAGVTLPSIFATFMNLPWYQGKKMNLAPRFAAWDWVPQKFSQSGYYNVLITGNPMFKLYESVFGRFFDEYIDVSGGFQADRLLNMVFNIFDNIEKPKFVFMLFMETHYPYACTIEDNYRTYDGVSNRTMEHQIKAIEVLDKKFGFFMKKLRGTNTDVCVFSDHGELFMDMEGEHGHGHAKFHPKLFEIPLGRGMI